MPRYLLKTPSLTGTGRVGRLVGSRARRADVALSVSAENPTRNEVDRFGDDRQDSGLEDREEAPDDEEAGDVAGVERQIAAHRLAEDREDCLYNGKREQDAEQNFDVPGSELVEQALFRDGLGDGA